jgi:hypothetical protein
MTTPDILPVSVRGPIEALKQVASIHAAVERYLASLDAACTAAFGSAACERVNLRHRTEKVRAVLGELYRMDERGDAWGAVGDLEEEVLQLAVEGQRESVFMAYGEGEAA